MTKRSHNDLGQQLRVWAAGLQPVDAKRLASRLEVLNQAMEGVRGATESLATSRTRHESAELLSKLLVWLKDELIPVGEEVLRLAEPLEEELHLSE
jgi:hypothetical protein